MDLPRSSFYAASDPVAEYPLIGEIRLITEACRSYGHRRVTAELRHRGFVVNSKKVRQLMRENDLNLKRKRRYVATTDSSDQAYLSHQNAVPMWWLSTETRVIFRETARLASAIRPRSSTCAVHNLERNRTRVGSEDRSALHADTARASALPKHQTA